MNAQNTKKGPYLDTVRLQRDSFARLRRDVTHGHERPVLFYEPSLAYLLYRFIIITCVPILIFDR